MQETLLNETLRVPIPEGFHQMTEEETRKLRTLEAGPGVCLSDPRRHILVSMGWKRVGALVSFLLNPKDIATNAEKQAHKAMESHGYRCLGFSSRQIAGARAEGYRYTYTANGVGMVSETFAAKIGKTIYYFHFYARSAGEASFDVWSALLDGIAPAK